MKLTITRIILVILILLDFIIIFNFSNQNGLESSMVSRKVTIFILNIFGDYDDTLLTEEEEVIVENTESVIRKVAHFSIYTILGVLLMSLTETYEISNKKRILISLLIGIFYAALDEIHQIFIPGRTALFTDVLIDTLGVLVGMLIVFILFKLMKRKREKKANKKIEDSEITA